MATISDLLEQKGREVFTTTPQATILEAVADLAKHNIGSLTVMENAKLVGIITERDIIREACKGFARLETLTVGDLMTRKVVIGVASDDVSYVMSIMTRNRIRHLPVMSGQELVGVISIGDVVKAQISETAYENRMLHDYIEGKYPG